MTLHALYASRLCQFSSTTFFSVTLHAWMPSDFVCQCPSTILLLLIYMLLMPSNFYCQFPSTTLRRYDFTYFLCHQTLIVNFPVQQKLSYQTIKVFTFSGLADKWLPVPQPEAKFNRGRGQTPDKVHIFIYFYNAFFFSKSYV